MFKTQNNGQIRHFDSQIQTKQSNDYNYFYIFVGNNNTTMKELKQLCELIGYIIGAILSLPFIVASLVLIYIFRAIETLWKDPQGKDNI